MGGLGFICNVSILTGTIVSSGEQVDISVPTVRIPELPPISILPYDPEDRVPIWDSSQDQTVYTKLRDLIDYINDGGTPIPPVVYGADLEITVSHSEAGGYRIVRLPLAGKTFSLERRGVGYLKTSEYLILPSGGFELTDHSDIIEEGEFFIAHVFDYVGTGGGGGSTSSGFLSGIAIVQSDTTLDSTFYNKLIHVAGNATKVHITLPDLSVVPAGLIIPFETMINNTYQTQVKGVTGQVIYFGNSSQTSIYLGISETLWVMAGSDGWYVMKASDGILNVGQPFMDYAQRLNTIVANGTLANRADYPRLWAWLQANPNAIVTDTLWLTTNTTYGDGAYIETFYKYRGKFSSGDGSTTFRFPDHQDFGYVALKAIGGSDADRVPNTAGTAQGDMTRSHHHATNIYTNSQDYDDGGAAPNNIGTNPTPSGPAGPVINIDTTNYGQPKTVGKNVGLIPLIRI